MSIYCFTPQDERLTEFWSDDLDKRRANFGLGMCNTGSGERVVCQLGGIGCNVNHIALVKGRIMELSGDPMFT